MEYVANKALTLLLRRLCQFVKKTAIGKYNNLLIIINGRPCVAQSATKLLLIYTTLHC